MATERVFVAQPFTAPGAKVIASPFQFATTDDDNLRIESANALAGVVVGIQGRRLTPQGTIEPFAFTHTPNTDRSVKTQDYKLGAGALLNLTIFATGGTPRIGQTYVTARFIRGLTGATIVLGTLLGGYVTASQHLAYPGSPVTDSISGGGVAFTRTGTDPAPGVQILESVPTGARWRLRSAKTTLITDATAGTRSLYCQLLLQGSLPIAWSWQTLNQGPSLNQDYYWSIGLPITVAPPSNKGVAGLADVVLLAGSSISINALNLSAGDDFSAPQLTVDEWLEV